MNFDCRLGTPDGRVIEEVFQASDESALRQDLERRGFHIFEARPKGIARGYSLPKWGRKKKVISDRDFLIFNQEFASLLKAGLPLVQSLEIMLERKKEGRFREILTDVRNRVQTGEELSEAFGRYEDNFPRLYPPSLKAGERSGDLETVLRRFIRYLSLVTEAKKRVVSALFYPIVLIGLSVVMIIVLSVVVVPKFEEFFTTLEVELPFITKVTLAISHFFLDNWPLILLVTVVLSFFFWRWKDTRSGGLALDRVRLKLPIFGRVLHRFAVSEFCRSLSTLIAGGIPLVSAFETAAGSVGNSFVRQKLEPTIQQVREGSSFHEALDSSGVFPALAIDMVKVGEATGALDEMLSNVSDFFDDEVETQTQRLLSLVEPLMLVFLGVIVAVLLVSIYLPLFGSLSQSQF